MSMRTTAIVNRVREALEAADNPPDGSGFEYMQDAVEELDAVIVDLRAYATKYVEYRP